MGKREEDHNTTLSLQQAIFISLSLNGRGVNDAREDVVR